MRSTIILLFFPVLILFWRPVFSAEQPGAGSLPQASAPPAFNLTTSLHYGMFTSLNGDLFLAVDDRKASYQLATGFSTIGDYGPVNFSRTLGNGQFSARVRPLDQWLLIPEFSASMKKMGLGSNTVYSAQETGTVALKLGNEVRHASSRFHINLLGEYCYNSLNQRALSVTDRRELYFLEPSFNWQYIFSSANRIGIDASFSFAHYSDFPADPDLSGIIRFSGAVKLFEYLLVEASPSLSAGKGFVVPGGDISLSTTGLLKAVAEIKYGYRFNRPDYRFFYARHEYSIPDHRFGTEAFHRIEGDFRYDTALPVQGAAGLKRFRAGIAIEALFSDGFTAWYTDTDATLARFLHIPGTIVTMGGSAEFDFKLGDTTLSLRLEYRYRYQEAARKLTYRPGHEAAFDLNFSSRYITILFTNRLEGLTWVNPYQETIIPLALRGDLGLNVLMGGGLALTLKVSNLYNQPLVFRQGYPEPGILVQGGLKFSL